jgi:hypothetical protein
VRSKNCNLTISRDGAYNVMHTEGVWADIALHASGLLFRRKHCGEPVRKGLPRPGWTFYYVGDAAIKAGGCGLGGGCRPVRTRNRHTGFEDSPGCT